MDPRKNTARIAGFLYLMVVVSGTLYLQYIPSKFRLKGNPETVVQNIINARFQFQMGIIYELICWIFFLMLPVFLYKLFKPVHETWAKLMVVFAIVQVPIAFINLLNKFAVLSLTSGSTYLKAFTVQELNAQVLFRIHLYNDGNFINQIFWGLWLFPFGYLVFKAPFMPKILGILLMAGCFGYLIDFAGTFLFSRYDKTFIPNYITLPASLGEIGICLWFIIIGIKDKPIPNSIKNDKRNQ
ncbi:DUF4386 domain-containing protein [Pedobacter nototheniae]|uniref:DUF4386 domain-containing protein n=1 Tax=Pedobacter nototheniae TaxID=2488994 RepID=UPI002931D59B|nr:DUF4386 domain-containing protein [Pedobacter nototheniae]